MKSFMASPATIERKWYVVDAAVEEIEKLRRQLEELQKQ